MVNFQLDALEAQQARLNQIEENLTQPVAVVLEGRDTAGKSGTIRALTHYLPPKFYSVVCLLLWVKNPGMEPEV